MLDLTDGKHIKTSIYNMYNTQHNHNIMSKIFIFSAFLDFFFFVYINICNNNIFDVYKVVVYIQENNGGKKN